MINIIAPINQLGYGIAALNIVKALSNHTKVALFPIGQVQVTNDNDAYIIKEAIANAQKPDFEAPCIRIWHQNDMSQFVGYGRRIGFPFFELDRFNDVEKHHLNSLHQVFVSSEWAAKIVLTNTDLAIEDVIVIPLGVDPDIFCPDPFNDQGPTRFFNCGKWEARKGHDFLAHVFSYAFTEDDDVELVMMCENPFCSPEQEEAWKNTYRFSKLGRKVRFIPRAYAQDHVRYHMITSHCGVFPSRAEGWNLELLEMMACGRHVITTNYSAHTEFCTSQNARLIDIQEVEPAIDGKWFHGDGNWAKITTDHMKEMARHMQEIHQLRKSGKLTLNTAGIETGKKFTWDNTARSILRHV